MRFVKYFVHVGVASWCALEMIIVVGCVKVDGVVVTDLVRDVDDLCMVLVDGLLVCAGGY